MIDAGSIEGHNILSSCVSLIASARRLGGWRLALSAINNKQS